jgi:hypothetical protein
MSFNGEFLGGNDFSIYLYADGLERFGYEYRPLEAMAYEAEARFVVAEALARIT